jgi:hypothetical protein
MQNTLSHDFTVGDRVRVVDPSGHLSFGAVLTVEMVARHPDGDVFLHFAAPVGGGWHTRRFQKVKVSAPGETVAVTTSYRKRAASNGGVIIERVRTGQTVVTQMASNLSHADADRIVKLLNAQVEVGGVVPAALKASEVA